MEAAHLDILLEALHRHLECLLRDRKSASGCYRTGLFLRFLYFAIQHKDLPTVRVGRCRLITEKALREWLERKTEATGETGV